MPGISVEVTDVAATIDERAAAPIDGEEGSVASRRGRRGDGPSVILWFAMLGLAMVGMTGVRTAGFTVADWVFLFTAFLIMIVTMNGAGRHLAPAAARRASPMLLAGLSMLTLGGLLATFLRSLDPFGSALVLLRLWYITVFWFWTLRTVCGTWRDLRRLLAAFVLGAVLNSVWGIYQEAVGANDGAPYWGRSTGFTDHFNALGTAIAAALPLLIVWRRQGTESAGWKRARVGAVLVALGGIGVSGSMTAFAAAILGILVTLVLPWLLAGSRSARRKILPGIAGGLVVFAILATGVLSLSVTERFSAYRDGDNRYVAGSVSSRKILNEIALDEVISSPVVGVGLDSASATIPLGDTNKRIHSLYYRLLYETGILGLLGMLMIFALSAHQAISAARYLRKSEADWIPMALLGSMVVLCADALYSPPLFERFFWVTFALISVTFGLCRAEAARRSYAPADQGLGDSTSLTR